MCESTLSPSYAPEGLPENILQNGESNTSTEVHSADERNTSAARSTLHHVVRYWGQVSDPQPMDVSDALLQTSRPVHVHDGRGVHRVGGDVFE